MHRVVHNRSGGPSKRTLVLQPLGHAQNDKTLPQLVYVSVQKENQTEPTQPGDVIHVDPTPSHQDRVQAKKVTIVEKWKTYFDDLWPCVDSTPPRLLEVTAAVQCVSDVTERLSEYLHHLLGADIVGTVRPPSKPKRKRNERLLLLARADKSILPAFRADISARRCIQRWYAFDTFAPTLAAAADALSASCQLAGIELVRLHVFPTFLTESLKQLLAARGIELEPRASTLVSLAFMYNVYACGVSHNYDNSVDSDWDFRSQMRDTSAEAQGSVEEPPMGQSLQVPPDASGELVCRAFYKLREVAARMKVIFQGNALDVGASPGGWTAFLATTCSSVVAVDPGKVHLPTNVLAQVEHLQMKIGDALPILQKRKAIFEAYVCDVNLDPVETVQILELALPLVSPGAPIVITFKNPYTRKAEWRNALDTGLERMRRFAADVRAIHLLANTIRETTIVGTRKLCRDHSTE